MSNPIVVLIAISAICASVDAVLADNIVVDSGIIVETRDGDEKSDFVDNVETAMEIPDVPGPEMHYLAVLKNGLENLKDQEARLSLLESKCSLVTSKDNDVGISLPIAFSAYLGSLIHDVKINSTVIFDKVLTNDGDGYDKTTGEFTAPISGVYVFSIVLVANYHSYLSAVMMVDSKVVSALSADTRHVRSDAMGGNTVVLHIHKGEVVKVNYMYGAEVIASGQPTPGYSTFSGFLMYVI